MQNTRIALASSILVFLGSYILLPFIIGASLSEKIISLSYFTLLIYSTGYSVTKGVVFTKDFFELHLMRSGIGLAALPLIIVLLDTLGVPLHWLVLLIISLSYPLWMTVKSSGLKRRFKCSIPEPDWHTVLTLLLASLLFFLALKGSFAYPYLEDGDSWEHAVGTKYVSLYHTYLKPDGVYVSHYLPPYPPTYDAIMAMIHQLNNHLQWTLKAFNAIMVALTYVYAYYFIREYTGRSDLGLYSVFFLAGAPAFGSHTIWSHTLGMAVLYPVFYCIAKLGSDPWFPRLSIILLASSMITQPLVSMVIGILYLLYLISHSAHNRKDSKKLLQIGVAALLISMVYWIPSVVNYGVELENVDRVGGEVLDLNFRFGFSDKDKPPGLDTLVFPLTHGDIYMQHGFGLLFSVMMAYALASILLNSRKYGSFLMERKWLLTSLLWFIFMFTALESVALPVSVYPARFWGMLPIAGSILAAYSTSDFLDFVKKMGGSPKIGLLLIVVLLFATSGYHKARVQLSSNGWPSDIKSLLDNQISGFISLASLPSDTMVYPLCLKDKYVMGMDKMSLPWDKEAVEFRDTAFARTSQETHNFLKSNGFQYFLIDSYCIKKCVDYNLPKGSDNTKHKYVEAECTKEYASYINSIMNDAGFKRIYAGRKIGVFIVE
ncbi:MAG: glycosyltransferase family 39 protein [Candidatus Altiarchaeota archaeon]